jgi:hypothetical protein
MIDKARAGLALGMRGQSLWVDDGAHETHTGASYGADA